MSEAIQAGVGSISVVKQTAKGAAPDFTATTRPADRPKWDDGFLDVNKTLGSADYVNGRVFGSPQTFTKTIGGEVGNLVLQMEPSNVGIYLAIITASDTVTGSADPYTHTGTSDSTASQTYIAIMQSVGGASMLKRQIFADAKIGALTLQSTEADNVLKADCKINALHAGVVEATDASRAENGEDSYLHTETEGNVTLDGTVICEVGEMAVTLDRKQSLSWGNSVKACQIADGDAEIIASLKSIVTDDTLGKVNKAIYNTPTPADGDVPVKDVYYFGMTRKWVRSATRSLEIQTPKIAVNPADLGFGAKKDGGFQDITFGGQVLRPSNAPALTWIAKTGDSAAYV